MASANCFTRKNNILTEFAGGWWSKCLCVCVCVCVRVCCCTYRSCFCQHTATLHVLDLVWLCVWSPKNTLGTSVSTIMCVCVCETESKMLGLKSSLKEID